MHRPILSATFLAALLVSTPALADNREASAAEAYRRGVAAYDAGNVSSAYGEFLKAWEYLPSFDIAANLARVEEELELFAAAANHYAYAVDHFPPSQPAAVLAAIRESLRAVEKRCITLHIVTTPADAMVTIDDREHQIIEGFTHIPSGASKVTVSAAGFSSESQAVTGQAGALVRLRFDLAAKPDVLQPTAPAPAAVPAPAAQTAEEAEETSPSLRIPVVVTGATLSLVGLGAAAYFLSNASSSEERAASSRDELAGSDCVAPRPAQAGSCRDLAGAVDDRNRENKLGTISLVSGAALGVASAAAYFFWPTSETRVAVAPSPSGFALVGSGSF